jgi:hypothetical protein
MLEHLKFCNGNVNIFLFKPVPEGSWTILEQAIISILIKTSNFMKSIHYEYIMTGIHVRKVTGI